MSSNPPYYYARACRETVMRGGLRSGAVDTMGLKSYERNSIIAEFCRRVQSVIWNRAMIVTESGKLGLVSNCVKEGDLICILYGCSVPVILRYERRKDVKMRVAEQVQDSLEAMRSAMKTCVKRRALRAQYIKKKAEDKDHEKFVKDALNGHWDRNPKKPSTPKAKTFYQKEWSNDEDARVSNVQNFNQIRSMERHGRKELLTCWLAASKTDDKHTLDDDNFSEDDFMNKEKKDRNSRRWGKIWRDRVAKEKAEAGEEEDDDEGDDPKKKEREKKEDRRPWRQEMAMRRDPWRHYTLQGEAYVHGLMDGEAVSDKFYKQIPDHLFEIR